MPDLNSVRETSASVNQHMWNPAADPYDSQALTTRLQPPTS